MKKLFSFVLVAFVFLSINSCNREDRDKALEIAAIDGEAFGSAFMGCQGTGVGFLCEPCCIEIATVASAIGSAEAATQHRSAETNIGLAKHNESEVILPDYLLISNNPFECAGISHNRTLFYILTGGKEQKIQDIVTGKQETLDRLVTIYSDCKPLSIEEKSKIVESIRQNITLSFYEHNLTKYSSISNEELFANNRILPDLPYYENVYNEVITLKENQPGNTIGVITHLNNRINELLNNGHGLDNNKMGKLGFLTIMKHSYYYWNN